MTMLRPQALQREHGGTSVAPMGQPAPRAVIPDLAPGEQRFTLHGITWEQYETLRAATDHIPGSG